MICWDQLLYYFSQSRAEGQHVWDYIPFTAISPCYLPSGIITPAWILEQVRGDVSSDLIKLRPGSAICLQDISRQDAFYDPAAPTVLGTIDHMLWQEEGYQVASISMHVYSPRGYDFQHAYLSFAAIPTHYVDPSFLLSRIPYNSLGQTSLNDDINPPHRVWEPAGYGLRRFDLGEMVVEDRSQAVSNWVNEQGGLGWI